MNIRLATPITELPKIGPAVGKKFQRLQINTVHDLLAHFPFRHEDLRRIVPIARLTLQTTAVIRGKIQIIKTRRAWRRRGMNVTDGLVADRSGSVRVVWFNQPYLSKTYAAGDDVYLIGRLTLSAYGPQIVAPIIERVKDKQLSAGRILPVYRTTTGLSQRQLRGAIEAAIIHLNPVPDWLPPEIRRRELLIDLDRAIREIHFPTSSAELERARTRLKMNELLIFSFVILGIDRQRHHLPAPSVPFRQPETKKFVARLPFDLTTDQRRAAWEILQDIQRPVPMHRLLQGDVGSGKTVVAAIAAHTTAIAGWQTVLLAPTEILAAQHFLTFNHLLAPHHPIALFTRSQKQLSTEKKTTARNLIARIHHGQVPIVIGTHALLSNAVRFDRLGLVIVDEQHRFGVEQRHTFQTRMNELQPHFLSMTATPIPRTLALALFGDLQLSFLRHLPPGRRPISTQLVTAGQEEKAFRFLRQRINVGEQAYIVCPLIEESDELQVAAATSEYQRLAEADLNDVRLGLLHGRMSGQEKSIILQRFRAGELDVLVTTPVIEVGVDVPNATVMVIEGAERFGLAQLHQLRGRVGRSRQQSYCFLLMHSDQSSAVRRLTLVSETANGFRLAEEDLRHRGPGDIYGIRQSGLPEFSMASLSDLTLMQRAQNIARILLDRDPELTAFPLLKKKVLESSRDIHHE